MGSEGVIGRCPSIDVGRSLHSKPPTLESGSSAQLFFSVDRPETGGEKTNVGWEISIWNMCQRAEGYCFFSVYCLSFLIAALEGKRIK